MIGALKQKQQKSYNYYELLDATGVQMALGCSYEQARREIEMHPVLRKRNGMPVIRYGDLARWHFRKLGYDDRRWQLDAQVRKAAFPPLNAVERERKEREKLPQEKVSTLEAWRKACGHGYRRPA